jgi:hypothetical protein
MFERYAATGDTPNTILAGAQWIKNLLKGLMSTSTTMWASRAKET